MGYSCLLGVTLRCTHLICGISSSVCILMFNVVSLDTFTDLVIEEKFFILFLFLRMDLLSWVIFYPVVSGEDVLPLFMIFKCNCIHGYTCDIFPYISEIYVDIAIMAITSLGKICPGFNFHHKKNWQFSWFLFLFYSPSTVWKVYYHDIDKLIEFEGAICINHLWLRHW